MGYKKYSTEQELKIIEEYRSGVSANDLAIKYGFKTRKSITDKIKKYFPDDYQKIIEENKNNKKGYCYKLEKINNEFDAYFIGLLLTDGYIVNGRNQLGIDLADEDCISFLSQVIGKSYNSYERNRSHQLDDKNIQDKSTMYRLLLSDKDLIANVERFGIVEHKTHIIPAPSLLPEEEKYIPYIIRGIIDGDGNFDVRDNTIGMRIATKSKDFAEWIKYALEEKMFFQDVQIHSNNNIYIIETYQILNIMKLYALSYNKSFGMMRKYRKIGETFRDYNNSISF